MDWKSLAEEYMESARPLMEREKQLRQELQGAPRQERIQLVQRIHLLQEEWSYLHQMARELYAKAGVQPVKGGGMVSDSGESAMIRCQI